MWTPGTSVLLTDLFGIETLRETFKLIVENTLVWQNAIENQNLLNNVQLNPSAGPRAAPPKVGGRYRVAVAQCGT